MKKIHNLVIILSCYLILGLLTRHNLCKVMLINKQTFDEDLKTLVVLLASKNQTDRKFMKGIPFKYHPAKGISWQFFSV